MTRILPMSLLLVLATACAETSPPAEPDAALRFRVRHEIVVPVPEGASRVEVWMAKPASDPAQDVSSFRVRAPATAGTARDDRGNEFLHFVVSDPEPGELAFVTTFDLTRRPESVDADPARSRPMTGEERQRHARYLEPSTHVVIDDGMRELSREITGGEENPVLAARAIYDWELENVEYWVKHPDRLKSSGVGSSEYCLTNRTGNCTDFHSLFASLARAAGIPTRMVYGSFLKKSLDGADRDQSYHCWIEFFAPEIGWVPLDVAVADIFAGEFETNAENESLVSLTTADGYSGPDPEKVDFYFGALDARRVTWHRGRDLSLEPPTATGPVNALPKAHVEIDGRPADFRRTLTYEEE